MGQFQICTYIYIYIVNRLYPISLLVVVLLNGRFGGNVPETQLSAAVTLFP